MFVNYRVLVPEANAAPILWRAVRSLAGSGVYWSINRRTLRSSQPFNSGAVCYVQEARADIIVAPDPTQYLRAEAERLETTRPESAQIR